MEEITEAIQDANILLEEKSEAIEVGLEIVSQEMGNILQELRDNIVRLTERDDLTNYDEPDVVHFKPDKKKESSTAGSSNTSSNPASISLNRSITIRSAPEGGKVKQRDKTQKRIIPSTLSEPVNNVKEQKKTTNKTKTSGNILMNPSASPNIWIKAMKYRVDQAVKERKVFTVCGNFYSVRHALVKRGWIEKLHITFNTYDKDKLRVLMEKDIPELMESARNPINGYMYKRVIFSKMLGSHQQDFFWENNNESASVIADNVKITVVNRFQPGTFSYGSEQSLGEAANQSHWYYNPGISHLLHPRSYNLADTSDPHNFLTDFKITAAVSLLKWVVKVGGKGLVISKEGKVPLSVFHFAMKEVQKCLQRCKHDDIDFEIEEAMDFQWNAFLEQFYKVVHMKHHFKEAKGVTFAKLVKQAKEALGEIKQYWPDMEMDGCLNLWILKPMNGTQGLGIYMCRTLQYILKIIRSNVTKKYIAQKYIERPLLIYRTKFDIRQWFLVHYGPPLTIWIYKECYVRFSSQTYNLRRLHESIHLTNNSVQVRYKNGIRDPRLPSHNMWDSHQFRKHLSSTGHPKAFDEVVYPGMKQAIVAAVVICRGNVKPRRGCFEICGSDFMLSETYEPWLLEINRRPALYRSTPVTARMCPQVLEDVIKDKARKTNITTGSFELAYTENHQSLPPGDNSMTLKGKPLPPEYFYSTEQSVHSTDNTSGSEDVPKGGLKGVTDQMQSTLQSLLGVIRNEREKRQPDTEPPVSSVSSTSSMYTARNSGSDSRTSTEVKFESNMETSVSVDKSEKTTLLNPVKNVLKNLSFLGDGTGQT